MDGHRGRTGRSLDDCRTQIAARPHSPGSQLGSPPIASSRSEAGARANRGSGHDDRGVFTRAIYTAAKFGIADVLSDGALTAEAIAKLVGANPDAVRRMLRTLASRGIFAQQADGRFALTPLADDLRCDAPTSV
jgi:hypothetical protein